MRIEGSYTIAGRIERVYDALLDAALLGRVMPGCERLIQMGPPAPDGTVTLEARMCPDPRMLPVTVTLEVTPRRRPWRLEFSLRGASAETRLKGRGGIDLVEDGEHTITGYAIEIVPLGELSAIPQAQAVQDLARSACERISQTLVAQRLLADAAPAKVLDQDEARADSQRAQVLLRTARGRIVSLRSRARADAALATLEPATWAQRAAWMGAGLLIGITALSLMLALGRWLSHSAE